MLQPITGSRTLQTVLYFLLVNGEAYPSQIKRQLGIALTPIQRAFHKLEKGGIVTSKSRGKTRLFSLNSSHPLFQEVERLLRKSFSLMPLEKQKHFYDFIEKPESAPSLTLKERRRLALSVWKQLRAVKEVTFRAKDPSSSHVRLGKGKVIVERPSDRECVFRKQGSWKVDGGYEMGFSNAFRWTLSEEKDKLYLEHLRLGDNHPVFLFFLTPVSERNFHAEHHSAGESCVGKMRFEEHYIQLTIREITAQKSEEIDYLYF